MNKMISMMAVVLVALTVSAEAYFSIVNTVAYGKDSSPSDAHASYYSGYLCTVASAEDLFGGKTSAADMTTYIRANFAEVVEDLASEAGKGSVYALSADAEGYSDGQYAVAAYSGTAFYDVGYLAVLLYDDGKNNAFRAYGLGSDDPVGGSITFDDDRNAAATPTVAAWTAVPEPTSAILLLLGLAGLALKRRKA